MIVFCDYFLVNRSLRTKYTTPAFTKKTYTVIHFMGDWTHCRTTKQAVTTTCLPYSTWSAAHTDGPHPRKAEICQGSPTRYIFRLSVM